MRIGIIGTGWGTRVQVPAFRAAGLDVVALAGRNAEKTRGEAEKFQLQAYDDWQGLLASDVDLVSVVTPPGLHQEISVAALAQGKHVLCEKPTALDAAQAAVMQDAALAHPDQIALIDHELRFIPAWQAARETIRRGDLGALRHAVSTVVSGGRADPQRPWNWWSDREQGGGIWGAIGSHQIDTLRFLWGEIDAISAVLHTFIAERLYEGGTRPVTADDFAAAQLRLADGGLATLSLSLVASVGEPNTLTIYGEEGALRLRGGRLEIAQGSDWTDRTPTETVTMPSTLGRSDFDYGTLYLGHALKAYGQGDQDALNVGATFMDGLRNQRVLDAGYESQLNTGRWVSVVRGRDT